ncbi:MAG TPA: ABC transporter permease [Tepidisphaeraceae bacterium]|jgi:peptide/nickel transport system permease protein|nr:ABC transporter permease [Tepidisphaeraceae bacterium]
MTNLAVTPRAGELDVNDAHDRRVVPRSWLARAMLDTMGKTSARIGAAWIGVIAFCAVFAPILANSYPILVKINGRWSSPMVQHFTSADVTLFVLLLAVIVLLFLKRLPLATRWIAFAVITVLTITLSALFVKPPLTNVFEQYRDAAKAGDVQWVLNAPIPYSPGDHLRDQFDPDHAHPWPPSREHWMGTDQFGADITSHMIHACRVAMAVGFISTGLAVIIGIIIGGSMGYFAGAVDLLGMRLVEIFGSIPTLYLLLAFVAVFERNIYVIMAIIGVTSWVGDARFIRAEFLKLRGQDFVLSAIASGLKVRTVMFRHVLPNALAPLLVSASFGIASAILYESILSFLGLGLPVGEASWGSLLNQAVGAGGGFQWWLATYPGLAIFLTVFAYNLIGEALRDALDPRLRGVE